MYNTIYEKLTSNPNDPVGAFAYIIYKQQKVDYCKSFGSTPPTADDLKRFHDIASLDTSIAAYRAQGESMVQSFLNAGLDDLVERTEKETRDDVVYRRVEAVNSELRTHLIDIDRALQSKRTFGGWARDVSGNLLVNLVTVFVIGVLAFGYQISGRLQLTTENAVGKGTQLPATEVPKKSSTNGTTETDAKQPR